MVCLDRDTVSFLGIRIVAPTNLMDTDGQIHMELGFKPCTHMQADHTPVPLDLAIKTHSSFLRWSTFHLLVVFTLMFVFRNYIAVIPALVQLLYLDHTNPCWRDLFPSLTDYPLAMFCAVAPIRLLPLVIAFFPCRYFVSSYHILIRDHLHLRKMSEGKLKALRRVKGLVPRVLFSYAGKDGYEISNIVMSGFMIWVSWYHIRDGFKRNKLQILSPQETLPGLIMETLEVDGFKLGLEFRWAYEHAFWHIEDRNFTYGIKEPDSLLCVAAGGVVDSTQSLDTVPFPHLSGFLRAFESALPPGSSATLHFTARGRDLPMSKTNPLFRAAILAFQCCSDDRMETDDAFVDLPTRTAEDLKSWEEHPWYHSNPDLPVVQPTTLPVYVTQQDVIHKIRSQCPAFTVVSVHDISAEYIAHLDERARWLAYRYTMQPPDGCSASESRLYTKLKPMLRDEEFLTLWKAAVVRTTLLSRWEVVLQRA